MDSNYEKLDFVVVDSTGFIKKTELHKYAKNSVTTDNVLSEIRDRATKDWVRRLPFPLCKRTPSNNAAQIVIAEAKASGYYADLSATDLEVIALTYELHHHYATQSKTPLSDSQQEGEEKTQKEIEKSTGETEIKFISHTAEDTEDKNVEDDAITEDQNECDSEENDDEEEEDDDDFTGEWICPENVEEMMEKGFVTKKESQQEDAATLSISALLANTKLNEEAKEDDDVTNADAAANVNDCATATQFQSPPSSTNHRSVACLTNDFAMQNLLARLHLNILNPIGRIVLRPRSFVLWCSFCFRKCMKKGVFFCPHCGNAKLHKITATVQPDGKLKLFFKRNFQYNLKHSRFHVPQPQGGKHPKHQYVYCADQPLPPQMPKKKKNADVQQEHVNCELFAAAGDFDEWDGVTADNPFPQHDVTSRAAQFGARSANQGGRRHGEPLRPTRPWQGGGRGKGRKK